MQPFPRPACRLTRFALTLCLPLLPLVGCGGIPSIEHLVATEHLPGTPSTVTDTYDDELRIMSANIRYRTMLDLHNNWPNRRDLFVATVKRFDPDLLATQECLASQQRDLRRALPEYEAVAAGRNNGRDAGEMCAVFYKRDRFRKLDAGHFWLSDTPDRAGSRDWGAWFPRIVTWVKLEPRDRSGQAFHLFNTHFSVFSRTARHNSATLLRRRISRIAGDTPVIVTGDFNTTEDSDAYRILTDGHASNDTPLVDTYRHVRPQRSDAENTIHNFRGSTRGKRIDWILASSPFDTIDAAIDRTHVNGRYPSDHFPVQAILRWSDTIATTDAPTPKDAG